MERGLSGVVNHRSSESIHAYSLLTEVWSRIGQVGGQLTDETYTKLVNSTAEYLYERYGSAIDVASTNRLVQAHVSDFLARLHLRHITGNFWSPEDLFDELEGVFLEEITGRGDTRLETSSKSDLDVLRLCFGPEIDRTIVETCLSNLFTEGKAREFQIVTAFIDFSDTTTQGPAPTPRQISDLLHVSGVSENEVLGVLLKFQRQLQDEVQSRDK